MKLGEVVWELDADERPFRDGVRRAERSMNQGAGQIERRASAMSANMGRSITMGFRQIGALLSGYLGAQTVSGIIGVNVELERLQATLETFLGSREKAKQAFDIIQEFAAKTPFQLDEVVTSFNRMVALGLNPSLRALEAFGNIAAGTGKTVLQFTEAVADAAVGEFERLKEFGIKARRQGDQVAFTFKGVTTTIANNSDAIVGYLQKIGETEFSGALERQSKTLGGAISNLQDGFTQFAGKIGDAGFRDALQSVVRRFTEMIGGADGLAEVISKLLTGGLNAMESVFMGVARAVKFVWDNTASLVRLLYVFAAMKVAQMVIGIGLAFVKLAAVIRATGLAMAAFTLIQKAGGKGLLIMAAGLAAASGKMDEFKDAVDSVNAKVKEIFPSIGEGLKTALGSLGLDISALEQDLVSLGGGKGGSSIEDMDKALKDLLPTVNRTNTAIAGTAPAADKAKAAVDSMRESIQAQRDVADDLGYQFGDAFASIVTGSQSAKAAFTSMLNSMISDAIRALSNRAFSSMFSSILGGGFGQAASGIFGGPTNLVPAGFGGAMAGGGAMSAGRAYRVAESGRGELIVPGANSYAMAESAMGGSKSLKVEVINQSSQQVEATAGERSPDGSFQRIYLRDAIRKEVPGGFKKTAPAFGVKPALARR